MTHNTNINKLGYTLLYLVTGKSCNLPGLTIGNVASESVSDTEAVQNFMERILKTIAKFREAEMRWKSKDCHKVIIREYHYQVLYIEGDKGWY